MEYIKIILPAKDIPENATVHKKGGTYLYDLRSELRVAGETLITNIGCKYMFNVKRTNMISVIPESTELVWVTTPKRLHAYLTEYLEPVPK